MVNVFWITRFNLHLAIVGVVTNNWEYFQAAGLFIFCHCLESVSRLAIVGVVTNNRERSLEAGFFYFPPRHCWSCLQQFGTLAGSGIFVLLFHGRYQL